MPVTDFFRNSQSPPKISGPEEIVSDRDIEKLNELSTCIYRIQQKAKERRERYFDNDTILKLMDELALMIDNISREKSIYDYISRGPGGPKLEISAPVVYKS